MKLQALNTFDVLNKNLVDTIIGGRGTNIYDCSKKNDVDSNNGDYQK